MNPANVVLVLDRPAEGGYLYVVVARHTWWSHSQAASVLQVCPAALLALAHEGRKLIQLSICAVARRSHSHALGHAADGTSHARW